MNDDQMVQLLRDVPLPAEPMDRYAAVAGRRRRADGRRLTVVGASLAVVALVASVFVLTVDNQPPRRDIASVLSASGGVNTAHVEGTVRSDDGTVAIYYTGDIDFSRDRFSITSRDSRGQTTEFRRIGDDIWLTDSANSPQAGRRWLHSPSDSAGQEVDALNPEKLLASLQTSKASVVATGTEQIGGQTTTRYDVTLPRGERTVPESVFPEGTGQVYVDDDGRVRRLRYSEGDDPRTTNEVTFSDFGLPVSIEAPPASEVTEQGVLSPNLTTSTCAPEVEVSPAPTPSGSAAYSSSCSVTFGTTLTGPGTAEQNAKVCDTLRSQPVTRDFTQEQKDDLVKSVCSSSTGFTVPDAQAGAVG